MQGALDKLEAGRCVGARNPWAKTGLFNCQGQYTDSTKHAMPLSNNALWPQADWTTISVQKPLTTLSQTAFLWFIGEKFQHQCCAIVQGCSRFVQICTLRCWEATVIVYGDSNKKFYNNVLGNYRITAPASHNVAQDSAIAVWENHQCTCSLTVTLPIKNIRSTFGLELSLLHQPLLSMHTSLLWPMKVTFTLVLQTIINADFNRLLWKLKTLIKLRVSALAMLKSLWIGEAVITWRLYKVYLIWPSKSTLTMSCLKSLTKLHTKQNWKYVFFPVQFC